LSFAALSICFTVIGIRTRRSGLTFLGVCFTLISVVFLVANTFTTVVWIGRKKLPVHVYVFDTSSFAPLPGAVIEVLDGPDFPFDGTTVENVDREFRVVKSSDQIPTNDRGYVELLAEFQAGGRDGAFGDTGAVYMSGVWLRVTAPGYHATFMRVDGQSIGARDIHDESPIYVTIPVGKR